MLKIGDFVVKAGNGICQVKDIVHLDIVSADKDRLYYLLVPLEEKDTKLYIPVDTADGKIRSVMNREEAWQIINEIPQIEEAWIDNEKQREQTYKQAIQSCDPKLLVSIIKTMYHRNQKRSAQGKHSTVIDERFFKLAENNLYSELAFAIGKDKEQMKQLIADTIEHN